MSTYLDMWAEIKKCSPEQIDSWISTLHPAQGRQLDFCGVHVIDIDLLEALRNYKAGGDFVSKVTGQLDTVINTEVGQSMDSAVTAEDPSIWVAYFGDFSDVAVFDNEIDCLRYAVRNHMEVIPVTSGSVRDAIRNER